MLREVQRETEGKFSKVETVEMGVVGRRPEAFFPFVLLTGVGTEDSQLSV